MRISPVAQAWELRGPHKIMVTVCTVRLRRVCMAVRSEPAGWPHQRRREEAGDAAECGPFIGERGSGSLSALLAIVGAARWKR